LGMGTSPLSPGKFRVKISNQIDLHNENCVALANL